jgi:hypothetical protein
MNLEIAGGISGVMNTLTSSATGTQLKKINYMSNNDYERSLPK